MTDFVFNPGDKVKLKSGSPSMTIEKFPLNRTTGSQYTDRVECVWFVDFEPKRDTFLLVVLELVNVVY